ncbi:MAG: response regulator [Chitinophagaceae bacterium]|nr:response regulator [Chitinophagaceae bacterium]
MIAKDAKTEITLIHDIKEVSTRSVQFIGAALIVALVNIPINIYIGHKLTTLILSIFCLLLGIILFMLKKGYTRYTKTLTITGINIFFILFNFSDGLRMGNYIFFFPLLFALPFLISSKNKYNKEVLSYFLFTVTCFCVCIFFVPGESSWQKIKEAQYAPSFTINCICALVLSTAFSYLGITFEKKYSRELLEQNKRKENAMKARSQFLSQMGHELRTPMNGILGATNLLAKQKIMPGQDEYLDILKYCSNHMLELINNILDYNKIEAGKLDLHTSEVNLKQLLQNATLPFYNRFEEKRVELMVEIDQELDEKVIVDEIRMIQVLNNLLSNALKFTNSGYVKLKVSCAHKEKHLLGVDFLVEDTGIGIAENDFQKVFESFEQVYSDSTRKYEGTGLGLSIAQRLLNLMDSKLELQSELGKGSQFSFSVNLVKADIDKEHANNTNLQDGDLSGMRILIAEDNLINMLVAKKMLQGWNVSLTTAENGIEVLESLEVNANYNLILMDLEMPEMDGYTAVREIRKLYPTIPVLAYTAALIDQEMYIDLKETGFVDAVLKPCQPLELFSKIRQYAN